mmetsp:Transcript_33055/g.71949  ORF Transcript_33055/g.71949 Transcript_33055/m.71949 type:complete len:247 (+) Transcript_33055:1361-2101(+)
MAHFDPIASLVDPEVLNLSDGHVLIIVQGKGLPQDLDAVAPENGPRHNPPEDVEGIAIRPVVGLHDVYHEVAGVVHVLHVRRHGALLIAGVEALRLNRRVLLRTRNVRGHHVHKGGDATTAAEELGEDLLQQGSRVEVIVALVQVDANLGQGRGEVILLLSKRVREDLVDRLQDELHKRSRLVRIGSILLELLCVFVVVVVSPEALGKLLRVEAIAVGLCIERRIRLQRKHHAKKARAEQHVPLER